MKRVRLDKRNSEGGVDIGGEKSRLNRRSNKRRSRLLSGAVWSPVPKAFRRRSALTKAFRRRSGEKSRCPSWTGEKRRRLHCVNYAVGIDREGVEKAVASSQSARIERRSEGGCICASGTDREGVRRKEDRKAFGSAFMMCNAHDRSSA